MKTSLDFIDLDKRARPINATFGAQIEDVDLARPLADGDRAAFRRLLKQYKVLIVPAQGHISPAELFDFACTFGDPEVAPHATHPDFPGQPGVKVLRSNGVALGSSGQRIDDSPPVPWDSWHTDGSTRGTDDFRWTSVLQAVDIPEYGRDTMFADMEAAFAGLSKPMQEFLGGLNAVHSAEAAYFRSFAPAMSKSTKPPVTHPVVMRDPETGRGTLYVSRMYTTVIEGLRPDESEHLLQFLFLQTHRPEYQLRAVWQPGTIVIWDNVRTQHYLVQDVAYPRVMHRVMAVERKQAA